MLVELPPRLQYRYNRKKLLKVAIPFQGVALIIVWWCMGLYTGLLETTAPQIISVTISGSIALYLFWMAMITRMYRQQELMSIYTDGRFRFYPVLSLYEVRIPVGSLVDYNDERVKITTTLKRISSFRAKDGIITIKLPGGLYSVGSGRFYIGEGEGDAKSER